MLFILLAFFVWRVFDFLIASLAPKFIPYLGRFSHPKVLELSKLPKFIESFANFDGIFYVRIANQGYEQFEQAFFPLYPLLIRFLSQTPVETKIVAGLLISNLSFLLGLFVFWKYLKMVFVERKMAGGPPFWVILFLLVFPTSFFFGAVYTEGLFFLLAALTFYFLKKGKYLWTALFAALSSATRLVGIFLIIPIFLELSQRVTRSEGIPTAGRSAVLQSSSTSGKKTAAGPVATLALVASPFLGLGAYMFYLWQEIGDPFAFFTAQPAFGAGRSLKIILLPQVYWRYLKILLTTPKNFTYFVATFEIIIFTTVFISLLWFLWQTYQKKVSPNLLALCLFSLFNLILPTLTGTFLSIPRFALLSLAFFIFVSQIKSNWLKLFIAAVFFILHTVLLALFIQGYFVS